MKRRQPRFTRTDTLFPYPTLFRFATTRGSPTRPRCDKPVRRNGQRHRAGSPTTRTSSVERKSSEASRTRAAPNPSVMTRHVPITGGMNSRTEEHTYELQSLIRNSYAVFCVKKKKETRRPKVT